MPTRENCTTCPVPRRFLSVREAAECTGIPERTLRDEGYAGHLGIVQLRDRRKYVVPVDELDRWTRENFVEPEYLAAAR